MKIFLIGYMCSGKTSLGKRLARALAYSFMDTDKELEKQERLSIGEIFSQKGEAYFRSLESLFLRQIPDRDLVIALGGGSPCFGDNMDFICEQGKVVYLALSPQILLSRVLKPSNIASRPLLSSLDPEQREDLVLTQIKQREREFYSRAHIKFQSKDITHLVSLLGDLDSHL